MNKMKAKELNQIRGLSADKPQEKLQELKKDLFMLRMPHAPNQQDHPMRTAAANKDMGRSQTSIRDK